MNKIYKPRFLLLSVFVAFAITFFAQNETKKWYFSNNLGLDFSSGTPTLLTNGALTGTAMTGCASVADASGNLLFYTNGTTVWNQSHQIMANGTGLLGGGVQSAIIIKQPGNANLYYVFTVGSTTAGARYSIVDISMAAGQGSVTAKNNVLSLSASQKLTYTKNCNGTDYWVMTQDADKLYFSAFPLTSAGIGTPVNSTFYILNEQIGTLPCSMKFSPNGNRLAVIVNYANCGNPFFDSFSTLIYDFNNSNGSLTYNNVACNSIFSNAYSCEFSPDSKQIYVSVLFRTSYAGGWTGGNLVQYNFCTQTSSVLAGSNTSLKGTLQLASDGKIYCANPGTTAIGVINFPNAPVTACGYTSNAISTGTNICGFGLPNFMGKYFEAGFNSTSLFTYSTSAPTCQTASFSALPGASCAGYSLSSYSWNFGEPSSGSANTSTLTNPVHSYSSTGIYTVLLTFTTSCSMDVITNTQLVYITSPTLSLLTPTIGCGVVSSTASISGGIGPYSYTWYPSGQNSSIANNLPNGIFQINALDLGGGCSLNTTVNVNFASINGNISTNNALCNGSANGNAVITMTTGSGNYSYNWSNAAPNNSVANGFSAGNYSVVITDNSYSCTVTKNFIINQPNPLSITISTSGISTCIGSNVSLIANASGGTQGYNYVWTNGPSTQVYTISPTLAGNYNYVVTAFDTNNCSGTNTILVSFVNPPVLNVTGAQICAGTSATLSASGANSYTWMPGQSYGPNNTVNPATTTIYTLTGSANGCINTKTTMVTVNLAPVATVNNNGPICAFSTLVLNGGGGSNYLWTGPQGFNSFNQNPSINNISTTQSGNYTLVVTNAQGCKTTATTNVIVHPTPILSVSGNGTICAGNNITLVAQGAFSYSWNTVPAGNSIVVSPTVSTVYTVAGTNAFMPCVGTATVSVTVNNCLGTGIENISILKDLKVYPNPFNTILTLENTDAIQLKIYNAIGMLVYNQKIEAGNHSLSTDEFSDGVYLIVVESYSGKEILKMIKK